MYQIIVYHNLNDNTYYYKLVKHRNPNFYVGFINSYNHKIILIIDNILPNFYLYREPFKKRFIKRIITWLQKKI